MTHAARETADRTKEALAPYAAGARDTAVHLAQEARDRFGPAVEALGPKARSGAAEATRGARVQYAKHLAPQLEQAFAALPPQTQAQTLKAVHRAQEAALAAKHSAGRAAEGARTAADQARAGLAPRVGAAQAALAPVALQAQQRGSAALTALQGHVSAAEISELADRNARREQRRHRRGTGLAVAGLLAIGAGLAAWQWWRRQSSPEWLVEPPASIGTTDTATEAPAAPAGSVNGSAATEPAPEEHPEPGPPPKPQDDRPKPHDPRKPH
ncbi:DUF5324 family protein [Kitasatospora sp. MMS16-BH015]|uniref:DUF5324 family protein n=1 Tax=Kitasatospora sp. MMS16-BH015 TaxID=2018025 RepID=UPI000CF20035